MGFLKLFSRFGRAKVEVQPEIDPALEARVQAYLDNLRDNGPQVDYVRAEEEPVLALPTPLPMAA